jgi:hypothetical protein
MKEKIITSLIFVFAFSFTNAQEKFIVGTVKNEFTKELVPFASIHWKTAGFGTITDSVGFYKIRKSYHKIDTLIVSYIGFDDQFYTIDNTKNTDTLYLSLKTVKVTGEVVMKSKSNRGLRFWKNIVAHKVENNPYKYNNYAYELYSKLEIDLNNVNKNSFQNINLLKPFAFVLDNIDSVSDKSPFLPVFITETLSDVYRTSNPEKLREIIKAAQTHGIKNESILQFVGGVNQKINIYQDYINLLGKEFVSPISKNGDKFYNYKAADTQTVNGQKFFHLFFNPLKDGENTFNGECWIHGATWAIQKITINLSKTADVNFVNRMSIIQEFTQLENKQWIFSKDKVVLDVSPFKKDKFTFIARKTAQYKNIRMDAEEVEKEIVKNKIKEEVIVDENAIEKDKQFWELNRHEALSKNEKQIFWMIDTLKQVPVFKRLTNTINFIVDGHKKFGAIEIGPWFKWVSYNQFEGLRTRFDLGTTDKFSPNLRLSGYLAYGFQDAKFKGKIGFNYRFPAKSGWTINANYINDLDNGRIKYSEDESTQDNVFNQILRRKGIPQKFLGYQEVKTYITKEWPNRFSILASLARNKYTGFTPIANGTEFIEKQDKVINTEALIRFRYAPGERKVTTHRKSVKIKSNQPVFELRLASGIKGTFDGENNYFKYYASISQKFRIKRFGQLSYNVYAGQVYGDSLPFMLLELHPGNEFYTYNTNGFNLMNRFEYYSDKYVGIQVEHNIEKKLINLIPFLRKAKVRQFWNFKAVSGDMSMKNRIFNRTDYGEYQLRTLRGKTYIEVGTGFDNLFKFFRIDFIWRFNPEFNTPLRSTLLQPIQNFGVFGSMKIQF